MSKSLFAENHAAVLCSRCRRLVRLDDSRSDLKVINQLYRLRCAHPACGFVDWYLECEFTCNHGLAAEPVPVQQNRVAKAG
jgi:hypothetical protein